MFSQRNKNFFTGWDSEKKCNGCEYRCVISAQPICNPYDYGRLIGYMPKIGSVTLFKYIGADLQENVVPIFPHSTEAIDFASKIVHLCDNYKTR